MNKKIVVPQGLINPNRTTIIHIADELKDESTIIVGKCTNNYPHDIHVAQPKQAKFKPLITGVKPAQALESYPLAGMATFRDFTQFQGDLEARKNVDPMKPTGRGWSTPQSQLPPNAIANTSRDQPAAGHGMSNPQEPVNVVITSRIDDLVTRAQSIAPVGNGSGAARSGRLSLSMPSGSLQTPKIIDRKLQTFTENARDNNQPARVKSMPPIHYGTYTNNNNRADGIDRALEEWHKARKNTFLSCMTQLVGLTEGDLFPNENTEDLELQKKAEKDVFDACMQALLALLQEGDHFTAMVGSNMTEAQFQETIGQKKRFVELIEQMQNIFYEGL